MDLQERLQTTLGDGYRLDRELGRGGMSRVFLAHERTLGRDVVVKVLPPEMAAEVSVERFQREIQLAAKLQHPHIVPVLSAGESEGLPYLVMPYIAGESLRDRLAREGELPINQTVRLLRDIATALDYAHSSGVVHRDIKPENVVITGGTAVVLDFGVAKALAAAATDGGVRHSGLTSIGVALGTPAYMAPEQAAADPAIDHRADVYSWGVVAYEMLTGLPPFTGRSPQSLFAAHMTEQPKRVDLVRKGCPPALADLVMRALEKRPADRPQSAAELVQSLDNLGVTVSSGSTPAPILGFRRRPVAWMYALGAVAVVLTGAGVLLTRGDNAPVAATTIRSVAVLPFVDAGSGGGQDDYFVEGMSDELSAALGRIPGLQVASRTSTYAFKGESVDVRQVGERLKVDAVLEGRVRRAGDRLRVTAQLTNVNTGLSFWTDSYEREVKDVFTVQEDLARSIASALQVRLSTATTTAGQAQGTSNLEAYDLYLRGRYYLYRRGAENLRSAIDYFQQAIGRDGRFARAYAGLAMAEVLLPEYSNDVDADEYNRRAEESAERALQLDSTIAEAHTAHGLAHVHRFEWGEAEEAYRRALALDPRNATAHQWYGELSYHIGKTGEAVMHLRHAAELEPLAPIVAVALSYALVTNRDYPAALAEAERGVSLAPDLGIAWRGVALAAAHMRDYDTALRANARAAALERAFDLRVAQGAWVLGQAGHRTDALSALRELQRRSAGPYPLMWAYLAVGDQARAAAELERAADHRDLMLTSFSIVAEPAFDGMRSQPAYQRAVRKLGLAAAGQAGR